MQGPRILREKACIEKMITLYCTAKHGTDKILCDDCQALSSYAAQRLTHCKFGERKPVCAKCPIHCYRPSERIKIIDVMRYSGPRMLFRHPKMAVLHLIDTFRKPPTKM